MHQYSAAAAGTDPPACSYRRAAAAAAGVLLQPALLTEPHKFSVTNPPRFLDSLSVVLRPFLLPPLSACMHGARKPLTNIMLIGMLITSTRWQSHSESPHCVLTVTPACLMHWYGKVFKYREA